MSELVNNLLEIKNDIKNAIEYKGGIIKGGMTTYANSIIGIGTERKIAIPANTKFGYSTIKYMPKIDTSSYTTMNSMFANCSNLTSIEELDTSNVTTMNRTFSHCSSLVKLPQLDTSKVTDMSYMFNWCTSLTTVPYLDTTEVTDASGMFANCSSLVSVPTIAAGNIEYVSYGSDTGMFANCTALTDIGGLVDFGKSILGDRLNRLEGTNAGIFYKCINISRQSCINIFNNLYNVSNLKLTFESAVLTRLQDEDIAIATNKGWTITEY